jgi:hypothetical protein
MADLIDRNASIRFISNIERDNEDRLFSFEEIKKMLRDAPAVNRWISVEDALPENITPVIITYANRYPIMPCYQKDKNKPYVGAAYCHNDKWFWYSATCEDLLAEYGYSFADEMDDAIEVLAWMPLPEPPKE